LHHILIGKVSSLPRGAGLVNIAFSANIGNAKVLGLSHDLKLTNGQYNWALSIFFVGK
jgi:hypothetical protein